MLLANAPHPYALQADVDTIFVIPALTLAYAFALRRFGAPRWRIVCFGGSMFTLALAFWTPLHHLGLHYLLTAHLLQNVILAEWAPLLAVLAISRPMAEALARFRVWRIAVHPAVALPAWLVNYFAWHVPAIYDAALHHQRWLVHIEHACYFGTGLLFWWPIVSGRLSPPAGLAYLAIAFVGSSFLGLAYIFSSSVFYSFYVQAPRLWGLSPIRDQNLGGILMNGEQTVVFLLAIGWFVLRLLDEEHANAADGSPARG